MNSTKIKTLLLQGNKLKELKGLEKLRSLEVLNVKGNFLKSVCLANQFRQMRVLDVSQNQITKIDGLGLENMPNLEILDVSHNFLRNLQNLPKLANLRVLRIGDNKLEEVKISDLAQNCAFLEELDLRRNRIKNFSKNQVVPDNLSSIIDLNVSGNLLKNLHFLEFFDNICILNACDNQIGNNPM